MNKRILFFFSLALFFIASSAYASTLDSTILLQKQDTVNQNRLHPYRLAAAGAFTTSMLLVPYIYLQNAWWKGKSTSFHFDDIRNGSDIRYAQNIDKAGHFMGGVLVSDIGKSWMEWGGLKPRPAAWLGAFMGTFYQFTIEMKDAYGPYYGFSILDLSSGTLGSLSIVARTYFPKADLVDFKFSYYYRSSHYFDMAAIQKPSATTGIAYDWFEDYINQNYWLSFNLAKAIHPQKHWTNCLGLAFGVGLDDTQYLDKSLTKRGGNREYYIALDYDLTELAKHIKSPTGRKIAYWLNYIKLPAPTFQIYPVRKFYPFYM